MATEKEKQAFDLFIENSPFLQGPLAHWGLIKTGISLLPEKPKQQITELTMLRELIESMEKRGIENPEYLIRNIELLKF